MRKLTRLTSLTLGAAIACSLSSRAFAQTDESTVEPVERVGWSSEPMVIDADTGLMIPAVVEEPHSRTRHAGRGRDRASESVFAASWVFEPGIGLMVPVAFVDGAATGRQGTRRGATGRPARTTTSVARSRDDSGTNAPQHFRIDEYTGLMIPDGPF